MSAKRQLTLNLFIYPGGHHEAAWRHPNSSPDDLLDIAFYQDLAKRAEEATFDSLFFADGPVLADNIRYASRFRVEPITWLAAIAGVTRSIGLIATASTTYFEPYNLARLFASLDHLSRGRAGWNIVTTSAGQAAQNFGLSEHPAHTERYERGREFVELITKLWDSWEDDAVAADQASGLFADTSKIHFVDHIGRHFRVKGPLNIPRSPQGRPVYVQAGSSEDGRLFAAQYAEAIFTAHQTIESARNFYADIKKRAAAFGRHPDHVKILPGISPFIGSTEAEARRLEEEFDALIQPDYSLTQLNRMLGIDLSSFDLDGPFPRHLLDRDGAIGVASRFQLVADIIDRENPTIRQLIQRLAGGRGHYVKAGTPEQIADEIQLWFENGAADGFNVMPPWLPGGFDVFACEVVPLLRKRGLFRDHYEGTTLRDHYGLPRPESLFATPVRASA
ncbi:LLM class flavin-dependent oxidoreductase [Beijerinckia indica]|uniref:Nitrilotriacetate monooxygenase component A (NtA monooxygenase component A) (NtA-MO A) n=1 Tax=Beijerinckia indica subsp. indica (strain ATCC 9039 / DSM 1715 / NCIMB 8712) TaxID=395963 RepID=B2IIV6_BEII9|nr:LLM class flavin-dependent oxidoreductase [Beijerinckia indica]ACB96168.1 nitrilotriacetate monooxygenase component A (NtA monooxygenase component A) (NtA-MO A) [Beijerinckia indica subsp. indica ATCC 9039]